MTARINWEGCRITDDLDDIIVRISAYINSEDVPYVRGYIIRQFEIDFNAYLLRKHEEDFQKRRMSE